MKKNLEQTGWKYEERNGDRVILKNLAERIVNRKIFYADLEKDVRITVEERVETTFPSDQDISSGVMAGINVPSSLNKTEYIMRIIIGKKVVAVKGYGIKSLYSKLRS